MVPAAVSLLMRFDQIPGIRRREVGQSLPHLLRLGDRHGAMGQIGTCLECES